jgi:hypothetical protein
VSFRESQLSETRKKKLQLLGEAAYPTEAESNIGEVHIRCSLVLGSDTRILEYGKDLGQGTPKHVRGKHQKTPSDIPVKLSLRFEDADDQARPIYAHLVVAKSKKLSSIKQHLHQEPGSLASRYYIR